MSREQQLRVAPARIERAEEVERLVDRELLGEARLLERDAEAAPAAPARAFPSAARGSRTSPASGTRQPLEDLDGRRLAGAVGAEQAEALAGADLEVEPVDGAHVAVDRLARPRQEIAGTRPRARPEGSTLMGRESLDSEGSKMYAARFETPVGGMLAAVDAEGALVRLDFRERVRALRIPRSRTRPRRARTSCGR